MIITLVRHGQASFHADDYDELSDLGREQAAQLARSVTANSEAIEVVLTGALKRHKQTAEVFLQDITNELKPHEHPGWNEFDHRDVLRQFVIANPAVKEEVLSRQPARVLPILAQAIARWQSEPEGYIENWEQFSLRVENAWHSLLHQYSEYKHVWVFTSGGPIAYSVVKALGGKSTDMITLNAKLMNTSVTRFFCDTSRAEEKSIELLSYNEHAHVTGKHAFLRSYR